MKCQYFTVVPTSLCPITVYRLKLGYDIVDYPDCPFFRISKVQLNKSSAMRTLHELFGFQADPIESELFLTIWTCSVKSEHSFSLSIEIQKEVASF